MSVSHRQRDITNLHVQQLRIFATVYERSSYAAAAREVGLSAPSVWEQVRALEAVYGVSLFRKVGRRIVSTDAARRLYDSLRPILAGLESTFEVVGQDLVQGEGTITILSGVRMMLEDLAVPLAGFRSRYPQIRLRLIQGSDAAAEELLLSGAVDLAFGLEPGVNQASRALHYEPVYSIEFLAICPQEHALAKQKRFTLRELSSYPLVAGAPDTYVRRTLDEALHRQNLEATVVVETDTSAFTIACVRAGMGVGVLAGDPAGTLCRNLTVRSLQRQLGRRRIMVMWKEGRQLPAPIEALIRMIRVSRP